MPNPFVFFRNEVTHGHCSMCKSETSVLECNDVCARALCEPCTASAQHLCNLCAVCKTPVDLSEDTGRCRTCHMVMHENCTLTQGPRDRKTQTCAAHAHIPIQSRSEEAIAAGDIRVRNDHSWFNESGDALVLDRASGRVWLKGQAVDLTKQAEVMDFASSMFHFLFVGRLSVAFPGSLKDVLAFVYNVPTLGAKVQRMRMQWDPPRYTLTDEPAVETQVLEDVFRVWSSRDGHDYTKEIALFRDSEFEYYFYPDSVALFTEVFPGPLSVTYGWCYDR